MPCNFISSCFFLDSTWSDRDPDCIGGGGQGEQQQQNQNLNNQFPIEDEDNEAAAIEHQPPAAAAMSTAASASSGGGQSAGSGGSSSNGPSVPGAPSTECGGSASSRTAAPKTVKTFRAYLPSACHRKYSCVHCRAHLANHDELISKSFQGSQGRAYLFNSVVNIGCGPAEERILLTGLHAVADIYCDCCKTTLGWKYEQAFESSQKYKEGKYIIELAHMIKENGWENES